jgi:hypothetical protein
LLAEDVVEGEETLEEGEEISVVAEEETLVVGAVVEVMEVRVDRSVEAHLMVLHQDPMDKGNNDVFVEGDSPMRLRGRADNIDAMLCCPNKLAKR